MTTPTPQQSAGQILHGLLAQLEGDAVQSASGLLQTFFTNLQKTPTSTNLVAQALALVASAPLQLPALQSTAISQFATAGLQLLQTLQTPSQ